MPDIPSRSSPSAPRVAFQGERGAFSEAAAIQLLGNGVHTIPCPTFEAAFRAIPEGAADALLAPVENSLAGSVVRVFDLLLASDLEIAGETILRIAHQLIGCPGATLAGLRSVASHPVALAQCERFFLSHPELKRVPAEDTAGSVREVLARGDRAAAAIAGSRAAEHYGGAIIAENIHDNPENFTRFVLLVPASRESREHAGALILRQNARAVSPSTLKMSLALRLAHKPGALLAALEPFARHEVNLLKIESRPIHGRPWEYQFFLDIESDASSKLEAALAEVRAATSELRVLGIYPPAR